MRKIIGIAGFKGSGKTTVADYLCENEGAISMPLAQPIKEILCTLYPQFSGEDLDSQDVKATNLYGSDVTIRDLLRGIGMGMRKELSSNIWTEVCLSRIHKLPTMCERVVVPDIRMPEEADWLAKLGGTLIWVDRDGYTSDGDITEQNLSFMADVVLHNHEGFHPLYREVDDILRVIGW